MRRAGIPHPLRIERAARDATAWLPGDEPAPYRAALTVWALCVAVGFALGLLLGWAS